MHVVASRDEGISAEFRRITPEQIMKYGTVDFIDAEVVKIRKTKGLRGIDGSEVRAANS